MNIYIYQGIILLLYSNSKFSELSHVLRSFFLSKIILVKKMYISNTKFAFRAQLKKPVELTPRDSRQ